MRDRWWRVLAAVALAAGGAFAGLAACEATLRFSCTQRAQDIRRAFFAMTRVWAAGSRPLEGARSARDATALPRAYVPGLGFEQRVCGAEHRFTTWRLPGAGIGCRADGSGSEAAAAFGVALGDSFTEGAQVDDAEAWPSVLGSALGRRVVNLGMRAQGTTAHLERLEASGLARGPVKLLLLQVHENDVAEDAWLELTRRLDRQGRPFGLQRGGRAFYDWVAETLGLKLWKYSVLVFFLDQRLLRPRFARSDQELVGREALERTGLGLQSRNLEKLLRLGRGLRAKLAVLGEASYLERLRSACSPEARKGFLWIETDVPAGLRLRFDGHWNPAGHREIARRVQDALGRAGVR